MGKYFLDDKSFAIIAKLHVRNIIKSVGTCKSLMVFFVEVCIWLIITLVKCYKKQ